MNSTQEGRARDPRGVYTERLAARVADSRRFEEAERRLSYLRLAIFAGGAVVAWQAIVARSVSPLWLLAPLLLFVIVLVRHTGMSRARIRAGRAADFYRRGLARLDHDWAGTGEGGECFGEPSHPYAADLDLFGNGSLFQLLSSARTRGGEETLAAWLRRGASPADVRRRQEAVGELAPMLDLREELALLGQDVGTSFDSRGLLEWSTAEPVLNERWPVPLALVLAAAHLTTLFLWLREVFVDSSPDQHLFEGSGPFWIAVLIGGVFALAFRHRVSRVLGTVERPQRQLQLFEQLLECLERQRFRSPLLVELHGALETRGPAPSHRIRRLDRLVETNDSRHNMIFAPLAGLLLLGTQLAFAMERWRASSGADVPRWLEAAATIEALFSLGGYAYEHPGDPFPEIVEDGPVFAGQAIAHPLLPEDEAVRNDVDLGREPQVLLVSGSNMSGKSTLLRTVGTNVVLAFAGAPVRATRLRVSPFTLGACMRVQDSLQEGLSRFYAEITRLRQLVELDQSERPLLFLFDEILHGTNSHDRRVGADALIRGLVEKGSCGLVTTHDLVLARIAEELKPRAINVHFADHLEGERIVFDYRLRPGVVQKSNALELMRAIGLRV